MTKQIETDICVIGAGSGGLSVAAGAVQMGARVVLVEKGKMGGDCLNYGCVPSKALLACAKAAKRAKSGDIFGAPVTKKQPDFAKAMDHVRNVIAEIEPHDSVERFEGLGVHVIKGAARFADDRTVLADGHEIKARRFVIATGSRASIPPIKGLDTVPFYTNETIFDLDERPDHLVIVGAGPIGLEMAQAFRRLGSDVTVLERFQPLPKDDPELAEVVEKALEAEGVSIRSGVTIDAVSQSAGGLSIDFKENGTQQQVKASHLLIAAGRAPVVDGLDLEKAGITYDDKGISTDRRLRTSNKRVFAIGDVRGDLQFTHVAGYDAGIVIRNALFKLPAKADHSTVPWVTYTDPELAHVGLTEKAARDRYGDKIKVLRFSYGENDRARAEAENTGLIKVIAKGSYAVGVSIVGVHAGELIQPWVLAMSQKLKLSAMAGYISPYPTFGELNKRVAGSYFTDTLFSDRTRKIVGFLQKLW